MKILVVSDLHGDVPFAKATVDLFQREKFDKLYLLGDLLDECITVFNPLTEKIRAVRGNCDGYDAEEKARFAMPYINYDYQFGKLIVLTHGHYYDEYNYGKEFDIMLKGHSHQSMIFVNASNQIIANPGSLARPRDGYHSYMTIDEKGIRIKDFNSGEIIHWLDF